MVALWIFWVGLAIGGADADLDVERGRVALEIGEPMRAAELALQAAPESPEAAELYLESLIAAGLGGRALVEVAALPALTAPWTEALETLEGALGSGDPRAILTAAKAVEAVAPDHPDLLIGLWANPAPAGAIRRQRERHVDAAVRELARRSEDPVYAYRVRRLLLAAGRDVAPAAAVLDAVSEPPAPTTPALGRHKRAEVARVLTNAESFGLPEGRRPEVVDIADRAAEIALRERRYPRALEAWEAIAPLGITVEAVEGRARTLLAMGDADGAVEVLDGGFAVAVDPWPDDVAAIAVERRAAALIRLLEVRAQALEGSHPVPALSDQATADLLAGRSRTSPVEDRIRTSGVPAARSVTALYPAPAPERALRAAADAEAAGEHEEAAKHASAALFLFAWSDLRNWRLDCAEAHAIQARALVQLGQPDAARVAWTVALLLRPEAPADWWVSAAEQYGTAGHTEAAFARYATATIRDGTPEDLPLEASHRGPAEAEAAARAMALPVPELESGSDRARVARGVEYRFGGGYRLAGMAGTGGSPKVGTMPEVGSRMPGWSVRTTTGPLTSASLDGRAVVLLFWVADCASCLQALQETGIVARDLRKGGRDVAVVAVSMDKEERFFGELRRLGKSRVTLAHDPALGYRLGVQRVPTFWIIDASGTVRYTSVGWRGTGAFERALRRALSE